MAQAIPKNSVWSAMGYPPPRGRCNYKTSLMSPTCSCLRFMLHPVKAATSFECDGCAHHASFHSLENPAEDAIVKRWAEAEAGARNDKQGVAGASKKRRRIADKPAEEQTMMMPGFIEILEHSDGEVVNVSERRGAEHSSTALASNVDETEAESIVSVPAVRARRKGRRAAV